jgi:transcriptional regulator with XRE-family HTH domain
MTTIASHVRFREARERAGLSIDQVALRSGISFEAIWDIESFEGDMTCCYSPKEIQPLCQAVGIRPVDLFGDDVSEPAISAQDLVQLINEECRRRDVTLEQFEDAVGWGLEKCFERPELLIEDMTIDGLQWLCRELRIDWRRVLLGL